MQQTEWECLDCGKKFKSGNWLCADGVSNHRIQEKQYLLDDAPSDAGEDGQKNGRTLICNIPPERRVVEDNESRVIPGGTVEFIRGIYTTSNPEIQYWLDKKGGWCSKERWGDVWLSEGQKLQIDRMNLNAEKHRLEEERNALLEQVKAAKLDEPGKRMGRPPLPRDEHGEIIRG